MSPVSVGTDGEIDASEGEAGNVVEDAEAGDPVAILTIVAIASVASVLVVVLAAAGYIGRQGAELEDGLRLDIYEFIRHNPGEHQSSIMEEFDISPSTAQHHLHILEQRDQIVSYKEQKFKRYYINGNGYRAELGGGQQYKSTIAALKNPTASAVVRYLLDNPGASQKDVAGFLGLSASTVNWHVKKLEDASLVVKARDGKRVLYNLRDPDIARKALAIAASEGGQA
jgi:predicted transcriptional regulator